jgi:hypothetical protein
MRKPPVGFAVFAAFVFSLLSCGMPTIPSKVAVKANPNFNLPVGGDYFDRSLNDNVFNAIKKSLQESDDPPDLYDYYSDDDEDHIQTFLLSQKITDMDLDLKNNISADGEDAETIDKSFVIASLGDSGITGTLAMPLDGIFATIVGPPQPNYPLGTLPPRTGGTESLRFTLGVGFDTAVFRSGGLALNFSQAITIHDIGLYGSEGSTTALRQGTITYPNVIYLQGSDPLPKTVFIKINYTSSVSSAVTVSKSGSIGLSAATGVNLTGIGININSGPINLELEGGGFLQGRISSGQFNIQVNWPAGWQGFQVSDINTTFTLNQELYKTKYEGLAFSGKSGESLANRYLNPNSVAMNGVLWVTANNASFENVTTNTINQAYTAGLDIDEFSEVLIDGSAEGMNLVHTLTEDINDMVKWVDSVTFSSGGEEEAKGVGLRFAVTDAAEGLQMAVSSKTLRINTDTDPIPDNRYKLLEKEKDRYFTNHTGWTMHPRTDAPSGKLDFTFYFKPKDYNEADNVLTLRNVIPGTPYTVIKGKMEMVFDWTEAWIDPGNDGKLSDAMEMDLNFGGGDNAVLNDLAFVGITAQLFIIGPEGFNPNLYFDISYGTDFEENNKPFGANGKAIEAIQSFDLNIVEAETHRELPVVHNMLEGGEPIEGFDDIMNSRSTMKIDYTITVKSLKIYPDDESSQKMTVQMVILLPLQFRVNNPNAAGLVLDTFGDSDLFQRDADDNSLFDNLKSMRFTIGFRQGEYLFTSGKLYLVEQRNSKDPDLDPLGLLFDFSSSYNPGIYLGDDEISVVKDMNPYIPNFLIVPGKGPDGNTLPLAFRRNGRIGRVGITVGVETDDVSSIF